MKCFVHSASCFALCALCLTGMASAEELVRNPFWPQDYEGTRYPITVEPRFKPKPANTATNVVSKTRLQVVKPKPVIVNPLEDPVWANAVKELHFGATMNFSGTNGSQRAITINDRIYMVGDLVSVNCADSRFTWLIEALSDTDKVKLKRINKRKIGINP